MKTLMCFFLIFSLAIIPAIFVMAKEEGEKKKEVSLGMEMIQIGGGVRALAIKGMKIHKEGDLLVLEGTKEFVARKFIEIDGRIDGLESKEENLEKGIEQLREELRALQQEVK